MIATAETPSPDRRFILTQYGDRTIAFADWLVEEIILVGRSALLPLPFYHPAIVGVVQHQGHIVPAISLQRAFGDPASLIPEQLTIVRLAIDADRLAGAGLLVDRTLGSVILPQDAVHHHYVLAESVLVALPESLWEPVRWQHQPARVTA